MGLYCIKNWSLLLLHKLIYFQKKIYRNKLIYFQEKIYRVNLHLFYLYSEVLNYLYSNTDDRKNKVKASLGWC